MTSSVLKTEWYRRHIKGLFIWSLLGASGSFVPLISFVTIMYWPWISSCCLINYYLMNDFATTFMYMYLFLGIKQEMLWSHYALFPTVINESGAIYMYRLLRHVWWEFDSSMPNRAILFYRQPCLRNIYSKHVFITTEDCSFHFDFIKDYSIKIMFKMHHWRSYS